VTLTLVRVGTTAETDEEEAEEEDQLG